MCEFEFRRGRTNNMLAQQIILDLLNSENWTTHTLKYLTKYVCGIYMYNHLIFYADQLAIIKRQTLSAVFCSTSNIATVQRNNGPIHTHVRG
jgi:hypothetical protein